MFAWGIFVLRFTGKRVILEHTAVSEKDRIPPA